MAILYNDGRFADARELVAKALKTTRYASFIDENAGLSPRFSVFDDLQVIAADLELRAGEPQRAVAVLEKAMHTRPSSSILPLALARALMAAGQRDRAAEVAHALIPRDEQQIDALLFLGALEEERGKMDEAARLLERARVLAPRSPQVADAVGDPERCSAAASTTPSPSWCAPSGCRRTIRTSWRIWPSCASSARSARRRFSSIVACWRSTPPSHSFTRWSSRVGQLESDRVGAR